MKNFRGQEPERTCLGCRARKAQDELDRLALISGPDGLQVVWDKDRRLGGRGVWLCRGGKCLATALKKRVFSRAFRVGEHLDLTALAAEAPLERAHRATSE